MKKMETFQKNNKLKILYIHTQNNGVGLWRMVHPAKWINKLGLAEVKMLPFYFKEKAGVKDPTQDPELKEIEPLCKWADIIVVMRRDSRFHCAILMAMKELKKPVVLETDDFVHYVPPYNPGARYYQPGSEQTDIWSSRQFQIADFIQVSTPGLKRLYKQLNNKIAILPNCIDPEYWIDKYPDPKPHDEIRIGWTGANAHWGDLRILKDVMDPILNKYPQVKFHFVGQIPDWWYEARSKKQIINHKFHPLKTYAKFLHSLSFDIGIAPLVDNFFNRGKSHIRWLEYAVNKTAVVASPIWAYKEDAYGVLRHNKNVLFAKEASDWTKHLTRLIENESVRKRLGNQAYEDATKYYNLENTAKQFVKTYYEMIDRYYKKT